MNILTIDTALDKTYISLLFENNSLYKTIESDDNNYHSAYLIKILNEILNGKIKEIEYIGVNIGVGSFTGIRAGLSVVKTIANRCNIKVVPFNTFEVLSSAYNTGNIMLDARRNSVFYSKDMEIIELIPYSEALKIIPENETFICDNSLLKRFDSKNLVSFEENPEDLSKVELEIVKDKIKDNKVFDASSVKAMYVQTPPIFMK